MNPHFYTRNNLEKIVDHPVHWPIASEIAGLFCDRFDPDRDEKMTESEFQVRSKELHDSIHRKVMEGAQISEESADVRGVRAWSSSVEFEREARERIVYMACLEAVCSRISSHSLMEYHSNTKKKHQRNTLEHRYFTPCSTPWVQHFEQIYLLKIDML
jgi:hypothetical protein